MLRRRTPFLLLPAALLLLAAGCKDPAADAPRAEVGDAAPEAAAGEGAEALSFDQGNSKLEWFASKVTGSHDGGFRTFSGTIHLSPEGAETSRFEFEIDMASIWSDNERLTGHLRSDDFFDVPSHPQGRFVSTKIEPAEGENAYQVTGNLTLRGTTKSIVFPAAIEATEDAVRAKSEFSLNRMQFGVAYRGAADDLIREDVVVRFDVNAPRGAGAVAAGE
jgi:polyisoprenoid-binding protein YceI